MQNYLGLSSVYFKPVVGYRALLDIFRIREGIVEKDQNVSVRLKTFLDIKDFAFILISTVFAVVAHH